MSSLQTRPQQSPDAGRRRFHGPRVEVVVPVCNEQEVLERFVRRLHGFLARSMPFAWRIVIADNASTDRTWAIAQELRNRLSGVDAIRLERKGRGRALDVLHALSSNPPRGLEVVVLVAAGAFATISRYIALRAWVFARTRRAPATLQPASLPD